MRQLFTYWSLLVFFAGACFSLSAQTVIDDYTERLSKLIDGKASDSSKIKAHIDLAVFYQYHDVDLAIKNASDAVSLAEKSNVPLSPEQNSFLAEVFVKGSVSKKALSLYEEAIRGFELNGDYRLMVRDMLKAIKIYFAFDISKALKLTQEAIDVSYAHDLKQEISDAYYYLSHAYRLLEDKQREFKNLEKLLETSLNSSKDHNTSVAFFRLGEIYFDEKNYEKAIDYHLNALDYAFKTGDSILVATIKNRLGWDYYSNGQFDESMDYYKQSIAYNMNHGRNTALANAYGNIGNIYRDRAQENEALSYYLKSLELAKQEKDYYTLSWVNRDLAKLYFNQKNYIDAYKRLDLHSQFNDSAELEKYQSSMALSRQWYEADRKEKELELLRLKLEKQNFLNYTLFGGLILIILLGILLIRQMRMRSKERIMEMDHKVSEITQRNLRQQMNPHFIFNTLNSIQYYMFRNDKLSTNLYLSKFSSLMRKTLENSQHTTIPIKDELEALKLYLELESLRFKEKFNYQIYMDDNIDPMIYKIPTLLIQPFVENSICHGLNHKESKGYVNIHLLLKEKYIQCIVEDNGIGREEAMNIKNKRGKTHHSLGTNITSNRLQLLSSLYGNNLRVSYEDLMDINNRAKGTRVIINLPIMT